MNTVSTNINIDTNATTSQNDHIPIFNFASHNVRSFNNPAKQNYLISLYKSHDLDIIGLQETNFKSITSSLLNQSFSNFTSFTSKYQESQTSGFGVSLSFSKKLAKYVFKHDSKYDRIIYSKLQFADKQKLLVINVYFPPLNPSSQALYRSMHTYLNTLLAEATRDNYHIVLLGDFNADLDRSQNPQPTIRFMNSLSRHNLFDVFSIVHNTNRSSFPSFFRNNTSSRIDYIWMSSELTLNILKCQTVSTIPSVSDHSVVMTSISDFLTISSNDRRCPRKNFFNYSHMDDQKWAKFTTKTDNITNHSSLKDLSITKS
jgi:exonuclease III